MTKEEEEFIECYQFCLEIGWVHNTSEDYIKLEYFDEKKGRKNKFQNHLDKIINNKTLKEVHILIGEAPPYYPNNKIPDWKNRNYFYYEEQSLNTGYFKEPCKYFLDTDWKNISNIKKKDLLCQLSNKGVLIFDIFPIPIYQSTEIREKITWGCTEEDENSVSEFFSSRESNFNDYLNKFFKKRFDGLLKNINENKKINIYMFAPKLASVQFLYWFTNTNTEWKKLLVNFDNQNFEYQDYVVNEKTKGKKYFLNKSLKDFVSKLEANGHAKENNFIEKTLIKHPIFMN